MMIGIIGLGYVGKTVAACLSDAGHSVTAVDKDPDVVSDPVSKIYEPKLRNLLRNNPIATTTDYSSLQSTELVFVTLPTPANDDGSIDLSILEEGLRELKKHVDSETTVVIKSTVTPTTTETVLENILEEPTIIVNPEFLREGSAVDDFKSPDKIVIGAEDETTVLHQLYSDFDTETMVTTGKREAEMIKYANNTF